MNPRVATGLAFLLALTLPSAVSAWPVLEVTASEVLSVDPPRVKTTFTVVEQGSLPPGWCQWVAFDVTPQNPGAPDAPQFFGCEAPTGGYCALGAYSGVPVFSFAPGYGGPGTLPANTYSITTDRASPCVHFEFFCVILLGGVPPIDACLAVDMPVPAARTSWGAVKSTYR